MDLATGALRSLLPKLVQLLNNKYKRLKGLRKDIEFLERELRSMHAALHRVAEVPHDQLVEQVRLWANEVRELSYNMEDVVDRFLVCVQGPDDPVESSHKLKRLIKKMAKLCTEGKTRHEIAHAIKDIKGQVEDVAARRDRYRIDDIVVNPTATTTVDPRLLALYKDPKELVGIQQAIAELINRLAVGNGDPSMQHLRILSISGFGGLGKTTLAKAVYDGIKDQFECIAFVSVGRNPDLKKLVKNILFELDKQKYMSFNEAMFDERQLIDELRGLLQNKRWWRRRKKKKMLMSIPRKRGRGARDALEHVRSLLCLHTVLWNMYVSDSTRRHFRQPPQPASVRPPPPTTPSASS